MKPKKQLIITEEVTEHLVQIALDYMEKHKPTDENAENLVIAIDAEIGDYVNFGAMSKTQIELTKKTLLTTVFEEAQDRLREEEPPITLEIFAELHSLYQESKDNFVNRAEALWKERGWTYDESRFDLRYLLYAVEASLSLPLE